MGALHSKLK